MSKKFTNPLLKAVAIIKRGGLVIFPTETVYGIGANAFDEKAVKKLFQAKHRPLDNPLIVHIADVDDLPQVALEVPALAKKLIKHFWPGPLTLVLKKQPTISDLVTAGLPTVAVRLPNHALARALIREAGVPIAAPSANHAGRPSATEASHVKKDFHPRKYFLLAGEQTKFGLESTIINILIKPPMIFRLGAIPKEVLEKVIGPMRLASASAAIHSPGRNYRHYAPQIKILLPAVHWQEAPVAISQLIARYQNKKRRVGVLGTREHYQHYKKADRVILLGSRKNLATCGRNLFKSLRDFDRFADVDIIIAEPFPEEGIGATIMDRLRRASSN